MPKIMNLAHIAQMAFNQPLLATAELADTVTSFLKSKILGSTNDLMMNVGKVGVIALGSPEDGENIAVVPVHGILVPRRGNITEACEEVMSYELLRCQMTKALNDDQVSEIVLDIQSGGGTAQAAFECAEFIYQSRTIKPIRAIINFNAYSGAYLLASACTEIIVSDTSGVGSIGVYQKRVDLTKMYEANGIKIETFFRGARKVDFHSDMEMSKEERASIDASMELTYMKFVNAVAKYRNLSVEQVIATEADTFEGQQAVDLGLADRVSTPQDAINEIAQTIIANQAPQTSQITQVTSSIAIQAAHMKMTTQL
ncbi:MAG: S49 family peptidase [Alteromonadaceae bacterium]|nr:S49 family peptidase [Alteromonadaceae bacterium]